MPEASYSPSQSGREAQRPYPMDEAVVVGAHPDIHELAVRACREHEEETFFKTSKAGGESMHEYDATKTHAEIYDAFRKQHVCGSGIF